MKIHICLQFEKCDLWFIRFIIFFCAIVLSGAIFYNIQQKINEKNNSYKILQLKVQKLKQHMHVFLFFIRNRMTADECLEDKWLQTSETMLKFRIEAVFPTVKLRNYVTESFLESLKVSEVQLSRLREKFLIAQEAKVEQTLPKAKVRLESF